MASRAEGSGRSYPLVYLVRHARTPLNAADQLRGHLDPPLDETGRAQAEELGAALGHLDLSRVVSSPLQRAVQTAEAIAERAGLRCVLDERLIDRDYASCAGMRLPEVASRWGTVDDAPGVEPGESVSRRARAALEDHTGDLVDGPVVLVGHDAVNRQLLASLDATLGLPDQIRQGLACWNTLMREGPRWLVLEVDRTAEEWTS